MEITIKIPEPPSKARTIIIKSEKGIKTYKGKKAARLAALSVTNEPLFLRWLKLH